MRSCQEHPRSVFRSIIAFVGEIDLLRRQRCQTFYLNEHYPTSFDLFADRIYVLIVCKTTLQYLKTQLLRMKLIINCGIQAYVSMTSAFIWTLVFSLHLCRSSGTPDLHKGHNMNYCCRETKYRDSLNPIWPLNLLPETTWVCFSFYLKSGILWNTWIYGCVLLNVIRFEF